MPYASRSRKLSRDNYLFTSESVSEGHPDKVADCISDSIVDKFLSEEPEARVAVETLTTTNRVVLAGEVRGPESITKAVMEECARNAVRKIGYEQEGFHWKDMEVSVHVHEQSSDIAMGVDAAGNKDEGAGDQGIMFGYATNETESYMPATLDFSHKILKSLAEERHANRNEEIGPDSKSQVTLRYENGKPVRATSIVVSTQHTAATSQERVREIVLKHVEKTLPAGWLPSEENIYINPTGQFIIGGPDGDAGLTGRKIIVDTYGGAAQHGGGAFSGKDPTKVDRSAAYVTRYLAKNVVAAGLSDRCTIQLAYAIGVSKPLSLYVDFHQTGNVDPTKLENVLANIMDLSPRGIREHLALNKPIYERTAAYGHFGREPDSDGGFSWEKLDLVDALKAEF